MVKYPETSDNQSIIQCQNWKKTSEGTKKKKFSSRSTLTAVQTPSALVFQSLGANCLRQQPWLCESFRKLEGMEGRDIIFLYKVKIYL